MLVGDRPQTLAPESGQQAGRVQAARLRRIAFPLGALFSKLFAVRRADSSILRRSLAIGASIGWQTTPRRPPGYKCPVLVRNEPAIEIKRWGRRKCHVLFRSMLDALLYQRRGRVNHRGGALLEQ